ncbi:hypothetical protein M3Y94_00173200 [Aphelenchoides besseyi]|nr:hypothetical protein M3Y94_00173200 [Aphelenchoides besseyi]KAI6236956.1 hypothetical protein M3Y95_00214200 [Aphelenchoides besseyi]
MDAMKITNLPAEVLSHIFSYIPADQLEELASVCLQWNQLIKRNRKYLPFHHIDVLRFAFDREFQLFLTYNNVKIRMKNNLNEEDQHHGENLTLIGGSKQKSAVPRMLSPSCGTNAFEPILTHDCLSGHTNVLQDGVRYINSNFAPYFLDYLGRLFHNTTTDTFMFCDCFLTPQLIYHINAAIKGRESSNSKATKYKVKRLIVHGCAIAGVAAKSLYRLFFELIEADEYIFASIVGGAEELFKWDVLSEYSSFRNARAIHLFGIRGPQNLLFSQVGPMIHRLLDAIFKRNDSYKNVRSLQVSGLQLNEDFLQDFQKRLRDQKELKIIPQIYIDDLEYQTPIAPWLKNGGKLTCKVQHRNAHISIIHTPLRTTIFTSA